MSSLDPQPMDELLNALIDGELTAAEEDEVRQQIERDKGLAGRLQRITACRTLVNSMPRVDAPAELLDRVRQTLERRSLLGEAPPIGAGRRIVYRLLARRVMAVAAAVGLVGMLSVLVYSILAPPARSPQGLAVRTVGSGPEVLTGRLEVRVASLADMEMFLNRILDSHGLAGSPGTGGSADRRVYRLRCGVGQLDALLADLDEAWQRFDRPTLYLETGGGPGPVVVASVTPDQLARIAHQENPGRSVEVAREIAVLNSVKQTMPGQEVLAAVVEKGQDLWPTVPKPVLTSSERTVEAKAKPKPPADERSVSLTVVLVAAR